MDYDPFAKNCNHFTEQLIKHLCDNEAYYYPAYVNRFTKLGSILRMWFKPLQDIVGNIVNYEESEEQDSLPAELQIKVVEGRFTPVTKPSDKLPPIVNKLTTMKQSSNNSRKDFIVI